MENSKKKIAIYPGTFNPFTIGHLNILEKAERIFGEKNVIILVGDNPEKEKTTVDRVATIKFNLPSKNVDTFTGFLTDYIYTKEKEGFEVVVVRGLRNGVDLDYEVNRMRYLEDRKKHIDTVYLMCDKEYEHISSSGYRACEKIQEGSGYYYIAKELPTIEAVSGAECIVFIDEYEVDILKKYQIHPKNKINDLVFLKTHGLLDKSFTYAGSYVECLSWIKEQETKKND